MKHMRAGIGQLQQHGGADDLDIADGQSPGIGRRGSGPHGRHGHDHHRDSRLAQHQGPFDGFFILHQGRNGTDDQGNGRAFAHRRCAAPQGCGHFDPVAAQFLTHHGHTLVVFGVVSPGDIDLVEWRSHTAILGADHGPAEGHGGKIIIEAGHHAHIRFPGGPALPSFEIHHVMAAAIVGEVGDPLL